MTRFGRVAFAGLIVAATLFATRLAFPSTAVACSCARSVPIGELAGEPGVVIVAGTMVDVQQDPRGQQLGQFVVQHLFQGPIDFPRQVPIVGGDMCSFGLKNGWQVIFVASLEQGRLTPSACRPFGDLQTPEGQLLLQQATAAFGPGPDAPIDDPGATIDLALVAILLVGGIFVVVLFGAVILVFGRREGPGTP